MQYGLTAGVYLNPGGKKTTNGGNNNKANQIQWPDGFTLALEIKATMDQRR
jgi:hypothetical protein